MGGSSRGDAYFRPGPPAYRLAGSLFLPEAKFPAPCLPVTWEESLQAVAGRTLANYKNDGHGRKPYKLASRSHRSTTLGDIGRILMRVLLDRHARRPELRYGPHVSDPLARPGF
jgi:hypothetical protein